MRDEMGIEVGAGMDREEFSELIVQHAPLVFALAYGRLGSREVAASLTHEVFLRAWLHRLEPSRERSFGLWVGWLTRKLALDWQRKGQFRSPLLAALRLEAEQAAADGPPSRERQLELAREQQRRQLERQLRPVAEELREAILLHHAPGLELADKARLLGKNRSAYERLVKKAQALPQGEAFFGTGAAPRLAPPDDLPLRLMEAVAAIERLPEEVRARLAGAGGVELSATEAGHDEGGHLTAFLKEIASYLLLPLRIALLPLKLLNHARGVGLLLAMVLVGALTLYMAVETGWISPAMLPRLPFTGPTPPHTALAMEPHGYYSHRHRKGVDRRGEMAMAAQDVGGRLVAYRKIDYGVLVAIRFHDGRQYLAEAFLSKVQGANWVNTISLDEKGLKEQFAQGTPQGFTAWYLATF